MTAGLTAERRVAPRPSGFDDKGYAWKRMNGEDSLLVERARSGDTEAFGLLFEKHKKRVWNVAYRMTADFDEAEDLAQEVFVTAWRKLAMFRGESAFSTWLYRITVNKALNSKRGGRLVHGLTDEATSNLVDDEMFRGQNPSAEVEKLEAERILARLLGRLEPERRLALILREIEGLSYEEIASAMDTPIGTVRSRISRAREDIEAEARKTGIVS